MYRLYQLPSKAINRGILKAFHSLWTVAYCCLGRQLLQHTGEQVRQRMHVLCLLVQEPARIRPFFFAQKTEQRIFLAALVVFTPCIS